MHSAHNIKRSAEMHASGYHSNTFILAQLL